MNNPKVSVIIPVYNVACYIERCARSIFEQSLDSLDIIFVDDCTPDNSVDTIQCLLKEYPNRVNQTRILKMATNSGQAAARKEGIIHSIGDYIIHCDGDDWVDLNLYEKMYNKAIAENADIVVSDYIELYADRKVLHDCSKLYGSPHEYLKSWYSNTIHMSCWNKMIKKTVYFANSILPWEGLNMWEDNGLITRLFYYAHKMVHVEGAVYYYNRQNVNAITAGYGKVQVNQMIKVAENLTDFFKSKLDFKDFEKTLFAFQYLAKLNLITDSFENLKKFKELFPESDMIVPLLDRNAFSRRGRLRFNFVRHNMAWLFIVLFKIRNIK